MPLRTQQWIQSDKTQKRRGAASLGDVSQAAAQCHLEVPRAAVEGGQHYWKKKNSPKKKKKKS